MVVSSFCCIAFAIDHLAAAAVAAVDDDADAAAAAAVESLLKWTTKRTLSQEIS